MRSKIKVPGILLFNVRLKPINIYFYQHQDVATLLELDRFCEDDII